MRMTTTMTFSKHHKPCRCCFVTNLSFFLLLLLTITFSLAESLSSSPGGTTAGVSGNNNINIINNNNHDKLVLVTGGSRGIGRATCLLLSSKGYKVALNYCNDENSAKDVLKQANVPSTEFAIFQADISDPQQVSTLFQNVYTHFQQNPTGLVNNAAIMEPMEKDITKISHDTLLKDFQTNTCGPFYCTQEFVKRASTKHNPDGKGGSIVCISSISAESAQILAYGMSKAALEAMVAGLSKNLPLEGIRINTIQPGLIDTGLASPEIMERMSGVIPARRPGNPMEIAAAVEYLLSDASSYCSGAKLRISGGL